MALQIKIDRRDIEAFCQQNHILKLTFFGSIPGKDFRPDSDVDILVWFAPEQTPGLFRLLEMETGR